MTSSADLTSLDRRRLLHLLATAPLLLPALAACSPRSDQPGWPAWRTLCESSLSKDGRMIDHSQEDMRTTSEGQAYAMFFALIDDDHALFKRLLQWTQDNLAAGDLAKQLPAWLWGLDGSTDKWQVLDSNSAADADVWIAYCLAEASRRWQQPEYARQARAILLQIKAQEMVRMPGLGEMLLPGKFGFANENHWRLNPSYLPLPLLRRLSGIDCAGPWRELADNTLRLLRESAPLGYAPDWVVWGNGRVSIDSGKDVVGSYDAIRTYLWAGMTNPRDPAFQPVLQALRGPLQLLLKGQPMPEHIDTVTGAVRGTGPYGFQAAILPFLTAWHARARAEEVRASLPTPTQQRDAAPAYYSQMLMLFGSGWHDRRFRFSRGGELITTR